MGGIRRIRKWIFIIVVFVFILIPFFMKPFHSVSKRKISYGHFLLDVVNAKQLDQTSERIHPIPKGFLHNVSRQFEYTNKPDIKSHHGKLYSNPTSFLPKNSTMQDDRSKIDSCSQLWEMATRVDEKQPSSNFTRQSADNSTKVSNNSGIHTTNDVSKNLKPIHGQLDIKKALKWFSTQKDYLKDDKLYKHNFFYQLTSNLCLVKKLSVVILVHSAINHTRNRQLIRYTWGSVTTVAIQPTIIFMLGESFPENKTLQLEIEKESQKYGDIVQGDFLDTYKNLTYKHVMAIHWVTRHCGDVRTIVKIDDDVFVDVYKLVRFSIDIGYFPNKLYCHVENRSIPAKTGRWALSTNEYPFPFFPKYCDGMAYILSMEVAKKLLRASKSVAFFWIDDVYVTGLLAMKAGIGHTKFGFGHDGFLMKRQKTCDMKDILTRFMFYAHLRDWDTFANLLSGRNG